MRCRTAFPLARSLPSTTSAAAGASPAALFGSFTGTTPRSDFPRPWLIVVRLLASRCALRQGSPEHAQQVVGYPGSRAGCFRACMRSQTAQGPRAPRHIGARSIAFGVATTPQHPNLSRCSRIGGLFRGSIPSLRVPLSTLHLHPHGCLCMTRGRCYWLNLQRMTLSFTTSRQSPGARGLTPRSSGAPTAGHQARSGGTRYIFASPGLASCRRRPLSSNVRQRIGSFFSSRSSVKDRWRAQHTRLRERREPSGTAKERPGNGPTEASS